MHLIIEEDGTMFQLEKIGEEELDAVNNGIITIVDMDDGTVLDTFLNWEKIQIRE